jgi:hypothetical protein
MSTSDRRWPNPEPTWNPVFDPKATIPGSLEVAPQLWLSDADVDRIARRVAELLAKESANG